MARRKETEPKMWTPPQNRWRSWDFNLDYNTFLPCERYGEGCTCDGYSRCGQIENACVEKVDVVDVARSIVGDASNEMFLYAADRLVRIYELYDTDAWHVNVCSGYYGEEIDYIEIESHDTYSSLMEDLTWLVNMSTSQFVEYLLKKEYGFLLDRVQNLEWKIIEVAAADLIVPNTHYAGKVRGNTKIYENHTLPIGVYVECDGKYSLVDGYHRYVEIVVQQNQKKVRIIAGKSK